MISMNCRIERPASGRPETFGFDENVICGTHGRAKRDCEEKWD